MENVKVLSLGESPSFEEAYSITVDWLRARFAERGVIPPELRLSPRGVVQQRLSDCHRDEIAEFIETHERPRIEFDLEKNTGVFFDVTWELVRRGLLVPAGGYGRDGRFAAHPDEFKVTPYGGEWLTRYPDHPVYPLEQSRFAAHLERHVGRFGDVYAMRSQEALGCYRAQLYLASCAMSGAAAESILLALASERMGSRDAALREYQKVTGATRLLNHLKRGQNAHVHEQLDVMFSLLKHWRDASTHASESPMGEETAFVALLLLLRLAHFADERWDELVVSA